MSEARAHRRDRRTAGDAPTPQTERTDGWFRRELVIDSLEGIPWRPPALVEQLGDEGLPDDLWYMAVDELVDREAVLRVTPWPVLDKAGRLRFPDRHRGFIAGADADELAQLADLYRPDVGAGPAGSPAVRPVRVGDVFAARLQTAARHKDVDDLLPFIRAPLYDLSAPAREQAKTQYLAAVGVVLDADALAELYRDQLSAFRDPPGDG